MIAVPNCKFGTALKISKVVQQLCKNCPSHFDIHTSPKQQKIIYQRKKVSSSLYYQFLRISTLFPNANGLCFLSKKQFVLTKYTTFKPNRHSIPVRFSYPYLV
jgi:hypothetical protein